MPSFLIKVTWGRWQTDPPWLLAGELQAAALFDLRFSNNKLSMWKIEDDGSNLDRVLTALAVNKGKTNIENIDYVILAQESVEGLGIKMERSKGGTLDNVASSEWHYDLTELSASRIVSVAKCIKNSPIHRRSEAEVKRLIREGLKKKHIDIALVDEPLRSKLQALT